MITSEFITYQRFDENRYEKYDKAAKEAFSGFLVSRGCTVTEGDRYGIDLLCERGDGSPLLLETECRASSRWGTSGAFPFETVEIAIRRREKLKQCPEVIYGITNRDFTSWVIVSGRSFLEHGEVVRKQAQGRADHFLSVPASCAVTGLFA